MVGGQPSSFDFGLLAPRRLLRTSARHFARYCSRPTDEWPTPVRAPGRPLLPRQPSLLACSLALLISTNRCPAPKTPIPRACFQRLAHLSSFLCRTAALLPARPPPSLIVVASSFETHSARIVSVAALSHALLHDD
jgi:hypothetical protein